MKRVLLFVFVCMCQMVVFGQKEYEMVVKKTDGAEVVINVEDIERTFFRERTNSSNPGDDTSAEEWDHEYVPFVEEGKVWNCNNTDYADEGVVDFVFTMRGDTLIGENIYKKVLCQYEKYFGDNEQHYYCAVREEAYRVYLVEAETKDEKLIYDFSHPKDTLMLSNYDHRVARMSGTRMDYWPSEQLIFSVFGTSGDEIKYQYFVDDWIEGVGSWGSNPFAAKTTLIKPDPIFGDYCVVVSCIKDGKCLFDFDWMVVPTY